jgi:hypothetical protein
MRQNQPVTGTLFDRQARRVHSSRFARTIDAVFRYGDRARERSGSRVTDAERSQSPATLDQGKNRNGLILGVIHEVAPREGRDDGRPPTDPDGVSPYEIVMGIENHAAFTQSLR